MAVHSKRSPDHTGMTKHFFWYFAYSMHAPACLYTPSISPVEPLKGVYLKSAKIDSTSQSRKNVSKCSRVILRPENESLDPDQKKRSWGFFSQKPLLHPLRSLWSWVAQQFWIYIAVLGLKNAKIDSTCQCRKKTFPSNADLLEYSEVRNGNFEPQTQKKVEVILFRNHSLTSYGASKVDYPAVLRTYIATLLRPLHGKSA